MTPIQNLHSRTSPKLLLETSLSPNNLSPVAKCILTVCGLQLISRPYKGQITLKRISVEKIIAFSERYWLSEVFRSEPPLALYTLCCFI